MNASELRTRRVRPPILPLAQSVVEKFRPRFDLTDKQKFIHLQFLKKDLQCLLAPCIDLQQFPHMYPVAGITEALNYVGLQFLSGDNTFAKANGEYEWLNHVAYTSAVATDQQPDYWYMSAPSAIDGNYQYGTPPDEARILLDLAYVGTAKRKLIPIDERVTDVFFSVSKTFGLPSLRCGYWFRRTPFLPLEGLRAVSYFNHNHTLLMSNLMDAVNIDSMYEHYKDQQPEVCRKLGVKPSEVVFLATSDDEQYADLRRSGYSARICLTEYFKP